ncbi:MAG: hypothetical protein QME64_04895 [bacterium]|nr:hypothetical protein [bacterium]
MKKINAVFSKVNNSKKLKKLFFVLLTVPVLIDFFIIEREPHYPWDMIPGFYALFGFVACGLIVGFAKLLGKWLNKKEDYYD